MSPEEVKPGEVMMQRAFYGAGDSVQMPHASSSASTIASANTHHA